MKKTTYGIKQAANPETSADLIHKLLKTLKFSDELQTALRGAISALEDREALMGEAIDYFQPEGALYVKDPSDWGHSVIRVGWNKMTEYCIANQEDFLEYHRKKKR